MSLNWDISKVENHEEFFVGEGDERRLDGITEAFVWMSMATGLGKGWSLDLDFAPEFYARVKLLEKLNGHIATHVVDGKRVPYEISVEDVLRRVGLHVNVSPVSRAQFLKNAVSVDLDRDKRKAETARAERLAAA